MSDLEYKKVESAGGLRPDAHIINFNFFLLASTTTTTSNDSGGGNKDDVVDDERSMERSCDGWQIDG
jgi:hypothetical protein